ncbi:MAG: tRNA adenosine(34) deaminase TadA [Oscillospiraceae bacterium]|nr:tRNA adenosine(34) deaminase TadA [Oscillospiraceae bacterium]
MPKIPDREYYMAQALVLAEEAAAAGEVPVGCVITDREGNIIASGRNRREEDTDACAHAELLAIRQACKHMNDWRLEGCTLYVTLEPCPMCAGAIINSRIPTIVYGAKDELTGSCGSVLNLFEERYPHKPAIYGNVKKDECAKVLTDFFKHVREK